MKEFKMTGAKCIYETIDDTDPANPIRTIGVTTPSPVNFLLFSDYGFNPWNTRYPVLDKPVCKIIADTFLTNPLGAHQIATPVAVFADEVYVDGTTITLVCHDDDKLPIPNGGHRLLTLHSHDIRNCFLRWEIYIIKDVELRKKKAKALNLGIQNNMSTLANYDGEFDFIKRGVAPHIDQYASPIAYRMGEPGYKVADLFKQLVAITPLAQDSSVCAVLTKSGVTAGLTLLNTQKDKMVDVVHDVFRLASTVAYESNIQWVESKKSPQKGVRFHGFDDKLFVRATTATVLLKSDYNYFSGQKTTTALSSNMMYLLLHSFRKFLEEDKQTGNFKWIADFSMIEKFAQTVLVNFVENHMKRTKTVFNTSDYLHAPFVKEVKGVALTAWEYNDRFIMSSWKRFKAENRL